MRQEAYLPLKRLFDLFFAALGLVLLSPLLLAVALAVKLTSPGPVLFTQERVGYRGRPFKVLKFRTMVTDAERRGAPLTVGADPRITPAGRILRRLKLDELPQLINVLKGEMSLVGPRPTLAYQVEKYTPRQRRRLEVKPGLTGWAQIHGRTKLSWPERIEYDLWYVDNWSLALDFKIILRTFMVILRWEGIYAAQQKEEHRL